MVHLRAGSPMPATRWNSETTTIGSWIQSATEWKEIGRSVPMAQASRFPRAILTQPVLIHTIGPAVGRLGARPAIVIFRFRKSRRPIPSLFRSTPIGATRPPEGTWRRHGERPISTIQVGVLERLCFTQEPTELSRGNFARWRLL